MEIKITETSDISGYEKQIFKKEEDFLLIGKMDKSVNVVSQGEKIPIKEMTSFDRSGSFEGVLKFPTTNFPLILQYGVTEVDANSSKVVKLSEEFPNRSLQVQATLRNATGENIVLAANSTNRTDEFTLTVMGGTATKATVQWFVIGF